MPVVKEGESLDVSRLSALFSCVLLVVTGFRDDGDFSENSGRIATLEQHSTTLQALTYC